MTRRTRALAAVLLPAAFLLVSGASPAPKDRAVERKAAALLQARATTLFERDERKAARELLELAKELDDTPGTRLLLARVVLAGEDCDAALPLFDDIDLEALPTRERPAVERVVLEARVACGKVDKGAAARTGMVRIEGGTFAMGSDKGEPDEVPIHTVTVSPFWIDQTEVTVAAYEACVNAGACDREHFKTADAMVYCNFGDGRRADHPMNCVNFHGAEAYCRFIEKRLPYEAEWELTARGTSGRTFPWGEEPPTCARVVMKDDVNDGCGEDRTFAVGSKPGGATPEGVFDLAGNVWEWVADWYSDTYYRVSPTDDPRGPEDGQRRAMRGGSWLSADAPGLSGPNRDSDELGYIGNAVGFRCASDD